MTVGDIKIHLGYKLQIFKDHLPDDSDPNRYYSVVYIDGGFAVVALPDDQHGWAAKSADSNCKASCESYIDQYGEHSFWWITYDEVIGIKGAFSSNV